MLKQIVKGGSKMKNKLGKILVAVGAFFIGLKQKVLYGMPTVEPLYGIEPIDLYGPPTYDPAPLGVLAAKLGGILLAIVAFIVGIVTIVKKKTSKKGRIIATIIILILAVALIIFKEQVINTIYDLAYYIGLN